MSPTPTTPDGSPAPEKPTNPPTSRSGISGGTVLSSGRVDRSVWIEAGYRQGWLDRDQLNDPAYPDLAVARVAALARDARAAYRSGIVEAPGSVPCDLAAGDLIDRTCACGHSGTVHHRTDQGGFVCDMCPLVGQIAGDRPLREWLADQFGVLPTHIWTEDRVVKPVCGRIDALVDVVLRQETRILERIATLDPTVISQQAIDAAFERGRQQGDADRAARAQSEYDRGVAAGRASVEGLVNCTSDDHMQFRSRGFAEGAAIGRAEREAELLEQGWTPPGAVISWTDSTLGTTEPTDADLWETALQIAGSQRNRRELETETVRSNAVWFYRELKAGPPPDLAAENEWEAKTFPAGRIDGE